MKRKTSAPIVAVLLTPFIAAEFVLSNWPARFFLMGTTILVVLVWIWEKRTRL